MGQHLFFISWKWYFTQVSPYWIPGTLDLENLDKIAGYYFCSRAAMSRPGKHDVTTEQDIVPGHKQQRNSKDFPEWVYTVCHPPGQHHLVEFLNNFQRGPVLLGSIGKTQHMMLINSLPYWSYAQCLENICCKSVQSRSIYCREIRGTICLSAWLLHRTNRLGQAIDASWDTSFFCLLSSPVICLTNHVKANPGWKRFF